MSEEDIWVSAAKLAAIAEPDDPHAGFELAQAIVALAERRASTVSSQTRGTEA